MMIVIEGSFKMYDQFKSIFEKAKTDVLEKVNPWQEFFGLEMNPCEPIAFDQLEDEYMLNKEKLEKILYQIALVERSVKSISIITGSYGIGKTCFLYFLKKVTEHFTDLKGEFIVYSKLCSKLKQISGFQEDLMEGDDEEDENEGNSNAFLDHFSNLDYLLLDDCKTDGLEGIIENFPKVKCFVFTMSLDECEKVPSTIKHERILLLPESQESIRTFLELRLHTFSLDKEHPVNLLDVIDSDALTRLLDYTNCNPRLSLLALGNLLEIIISRRERTKISINMVDSYHNSSKLINFSLIREGKLELSDAKIRVLEIINKKRNRATPNDISTQMNVSPTNTSMHLRKLLDLGLIEFDRTGKNRYYKITEAGRLVMEYYIMKRIGG